MQFGLRTILVAIAAISVIMAIGKLGYDRSQRDAQRRAALVRQFEWRLGSGSLSNDRYQFQPSDEHLLRWADGTHCRVFLFERAGNYDWPRMPYLVALTTVDYRLVDSVDGSHGSLLGHSISFEDDRVVLGIAVDTPMGRGISATCIYWYTICSEGIFEITGAEANRRTLSAFPLSNGGPKIPSRQKHSAKPHEHRHRVDAYRP